MLYVYEGLTQACKSGKIDPLVVVISVIVDYMFSLVQTTVPIPLLLYPSCCTSPSGHTGVAIPVFLY